ncbi:MULTISPECIES: hypothetical protein [unclassified Mesorhizobium]|uniref:hypothetical protein n=1 Tax=unclassified Mesorhizobium TaxID=325217 RepID=UPI00041CB75E|nr:MULTISPECIES: hypothetical protein [unclassified Mesorhizobium]WJI81110.1 hypothetical protein NLY34_31300 [Mesorhizobium sp. C374B]WJI87651.1 hypothetical protein NLY42_02035 [Mesorhizobium sp. C372A]
MDHDTLVATLERLKLTATAIRQSGQWEGKSFIQGGWQTLSQALYIPALVAIRFNQPLKANTKASEQAENPQRSP